VTESEYKITINRSDARWAFAIFFMLGAFCSIILFWNLALDILNSTGSLKRSLFISFFLIILVPYTFYNCKMIFGSRFIFEISELGIKISNDKTFKWDSIYAIELKKFPSQGLEFLYYLIGPKGLFFYQIIIYDDFLLKKKSKIKFSSDINTNWDKINDIIIYYTIKHNIQFI
jgi:hypothetical protein